MAERDGGWGITLLLLTIYLKQDLQTKERELTIWNAHCIRRVRLQNTVADRFNLLKGFSLKLFVDNLFFCKYYNKYNVFLLT